MKSTIRIFSTLLLTLCLALFATSALAQTSSTGTIQGSITDQTGAPVPNATVTVTSPNLIRAQSTQTDSSGRYEIPNLPPGTYKVLVAEVAGFGSREATNVAVNLSKTTTIDVQLQPKGVGGDVTVTADGGPIVDVTNNTTGTNVSTESFSNFPTQRTIQSLYSIAPTVARSGLRDASGRDRDPSVAGSSGPENNYILDGVTTSDPAFGGSGANLPFEFIQEVEIKTGAFGAEYGKSTGGIFNVVTKAGGNDFSGDLFGFATTKGLVRETKSFPLVGSAPDGFSEFDLGADIGGPIVKDKLWFFGAFNPQRRKNFVQTQTFKQSRENKITTPFYAGKITYGINNNNTLTFSTFGDFTKLEGHIGSGFGDPNSFRQTIETGGHNYTARLNSNLRNNWIGEFTYGLHLQRNNVIPEQGTGTALVVDNFAVVRNGAVLGVTSTPTVVAASTGFGDFVDGTGGSLQRGFVRQGYGAFTTQDRNRYEFAVRLQNLLSRHTIKYGFEYAKASYDIDNQRTGPTGTFRDTNGLAAGIGEPTLTSVTGYSVGNNFAVCTVRGAGIVCPSAAATSRVEVLRLASRLPSNITAATTTGALTTSEFSNNPFLIRLTTSVRDFQLHARNTFTRSESFYIQDDFKVFKNFQINGGLRWDYQQAIATGQEYIKLNRFKDNLQPRLGFAWDFLGNGRSKIFANYARYLETPIPLDVNVRAGSTTVQTDKNFRVDTLNAPLTSNLTLAIGNLGATFTPVDNGLKPQTVNEVRAGINYELNSGLALGFQGVYRAQGSVIEDGSFDDGNNYFLFNPGEIRKGDNTTEERACNDPTIGCFGRARRYYRGLEFTATKRFTKNYQVIASYVYSSLIGNYEGLFRNDNGQVDPNITSLFDLVSLLRNTYGRLPNDRPHQFKLNGSYRTPFKLLVSGNFYTQSGIPFDQLTPHPVYGNNEGFAVPRGTAINPITGRNRTPTTYQLDMGFYYPIAISEKRELRLTADWFNVSNAQRAIRQDTTFSINSGVTGVPPVSNPTYGTGTIFQFPTAFRFGVKLKF